MNVEATVYRYMEYPRNVVELYIFVEYDVLEVMMTISLQYTKLTTAPQCQKNKHNKLAWSCLDV